MLLAFSLVGQPPSAFPVWRKEMANFISVAYGTFGLAVVLFTIGFLFQFSVRDPVLFSADPDLWTPISVVGVLTITIGLADMYRKFRLVIGAKQPK